MRYARRLLTQVRHGKARGLAPKSTHPAHSCSPKSSGTSTSCPAASKPAKASRPQALIVALAYRSLAGMQHSRISVATAAQAASMHRSRPLTNNCRTRLTTCRQDSSSDRLEAFEPPRLASPCGAHRCILRQHCTGASRSITARSASHASHDNVQCIRMGSQPAAQRLAPTQHRSLAASTSATARQHSPRQRHRAI